LLEAVLQQEGINAMNDRKEKEAKASGSSPEESGDLYGHITVSGGVVGAIGGRGHHIEQGIESRNHAGASPDVDPDHPPIAAIRDLLTAAFTAKGLYRFCQDRPDFRPLVAQFGSGQGLDDMVDRVIDHCRTQLLWHELLAEVAKESPRQFARFEPYLQDTDTE
jgi:hypothetical protein